MTEGVIRVQNRPYATVGRFVVPADRRVAVEHYRTHLHVAHGRWDRLRCLLQLPLPLGQAPGSSWVPRPLAGRCQVRSRIASSLDRFSSFLNDHGRDLLKGTPLEPARELDWILLTDQENSGRDRLVAFVFVPDGGRPSAVLKLRQTSAKGPSLEREAEALDFLARGIAATTNARFPRALAFRRFATVEALLQTHLPGRSLYVDVGRRWLPHLHVQRDFETAARFLARFHLSTRAPDRLLDLSAYERSWGEAPWLRKLRALLASAPLHFVACHGDFWAGNLLRSTGDRLGGLRTETPGVVDWEKFSPAASPHEDLFLFPLSYGLNYPWSSFRKRSAPDAFRLTFLERNCLSRAVQTYFRTYCTLTGINEQVLEPLFHGYLLTRSLEAPPGNPFWPGCQKLLSEAGRSVFSG